MEIKRSFKGVWIPKEIWLAEDINITEKAFLAEIDSLSSTKLGCFASNKHFSKFSGLSVSRCSTIINDLERKGYVNINLVRKTNSKEIEKRYIKINYMGISNMEAGISEMKGGYFGNSEGINTKDINTDNKDYGDLAKSKPNDKYGKVPYFNEFWELYPNKKGKGQAVKTFQKQVKNKETFDLIVKDLERRKGYEGWTKEGGRFIQHPSTYLNQEMWLDEYEVKKIKEPIKLKIKTY